jgi:hypothetical protein
MFAMVCSRLHVLMNCSPIMLIPNHKHVNLFPGACHEVVENKWDSMLTAYLQIQIGIALQ